MMCTNLITVCGDFRSQALIGDESRPAVNARPIIRRSQARAYRWPNRRGRVVSRTSVDIQIHCCITGFNIRVFVNARMSHGYTFRKAPGLYFERWVPTSDFEASSPFCAASESGVKDEARGALTSDLSTDTAPFTCMPRRSNLEVPCPSSQNHGDLAHGDTRGTRIPRPPQTRR